MQTTACCRPVFLAIQGEDMKGWLGTHGVRIALIVVVLVAAHIIAKRIVPPAIKRGALARARSDVPGEIEKRGETLSGVALFAGDVAAVGIGVFMVLGEFDYNLAPVLTGLGISGIAIGLGAQGLVKDTINGLLILAENQFRYGDYVTVAGVSGTVEEMSLRRTLLRDVDGTVHTVPNSAIQIASNHTRDYSGLNVALVISHNANLNQALAIAAQTGAELAGEQTYREEIVEPPRPARIETIDHLGITVRILGRVRPGRQVQIAFEYRRRLMEALDAAGLGYTVSPAAPPLTVAPAEVESRPSRKPAGPKATT